MLRMAWVSLAIAAACGITGFSAPAGPAPGPLQFITFLFVVLFLILRIAGSPAFRNLVRPPA